jgi:UDP-galactose transporter B1
MPSTARLLLCAGGIYVSFLSWALVQERLSTTPYYANSTTKQDPKYFRHVIFLNTVQSFFSACAALLYMAFRRKRGFSWRETMGLTTTVCASACLFRLKKACSDLSRCLSHATPFSPHNRVEQTQS